jgi:hypothetical protein
MYKNKNYFLIITIFISTIILFSYSLLNAYSKEINNSITNENPILVHKVIDAEIANSFGISLLNLKNIEKKELFKNQNNQYYYSLLMQFKQVMEDQKSGDILPSIYLNKEGTSCYIFNKKADGTNCIYIYEYKDKWNLLDIKKKKGKILSF